jgi:hypothetical protein
MCSKEFVHVRVREARLNNLVIKLKEGALYYYIFMRQFSQMELFYLYQSEVGVQCAFPFREALD